MTGKGHFNQVHGFRGAFIVVSDLLLMIALVGPGFWQTLGYVAVGFVFFNLLTRIDMKVFSLVYRNGTPLFDPEEVDELIILSNSQRKKVINNVLNFPKRRIRQMVLMDLLAILQVPILYYWVFDDQSRDKFIIALPALVIAVGTTLRSIAFQEGVNYSGKCLKAATEKMPDLLKEQFDFMVGKMAKNMNFPMVSIFLSSFVIIIFAYYLHGQSNPGRFYFGCFVAISIAIVWAYIIHYFSEKILSQGFDSLVTRMVRFTADEKPIPYVSQITELGRLEQSFNKMMSIVQSKNNALLEEQQNLEKNVKTRTAAFHRLANKERREKERFQMLTRSISHEVRTPLFLLRALISRSSNSESDTKKANNLISQISDQINALLGNRENRSAIIPTTERNADHLIQQEVGLFEITLINSIEIEYNYDIGEIFWTNSDELSGLIQLCVRNLLTNSLKVAPDNSKIRVVARSENNCFVIDVFDSGPGFNQQVFSKYKGQEKFDSSNKIGLETVSKSLSKWSGKIEIGDKSSSEIETRVSILIPLNNFTTKKSTSDSATGKDKRPSKKSINSNKPIIICIDDNQNVLNELSEILTSSFEVYTAVDSKKALEVAEKYSPDIILCDYYLGKEVGNDILLEFRNKYPLAPFCLFTAYPDTGIRKTAMERDAFDFIPKDTPVDELKERLMRALRYKSRITDYLKRNRESILRSIEKTSNIGLQQLESKLGPKLTTLLFHIDQLSENYSRQSAELAQEAAQQLLEDYASVELIHLCLSEIESSSSTISIQHVAEMLSKQGIKCTIKGNNLEDRKLAFKDFYTIHLTVLSKHSELNEINFSLIDNQIKAKWHLNDTTIVSSINSELESLIGSDFTVENDGISCNLKAG